MIICPKCKLKLNKVNNAYKCSNNHNYDIAKSGYLNLLLSRLNAGDTKEMLVARDCFLKQGFYLPIVKEVASRLPDNHPLVVDCGCGTGYYTDHLAQMIPGEYIGVDISKIAIDFAAKKNKNVLYLVASNHSLPLADSSSDILLNIFAPYSDSEFARILTKKGKLIIVSANNNHLQELKTLIYDTPHTNTDKLYFLPSFKLISEHILEYKLLLTQNDLINLFKMTPYYYKTKPSDFEKLLVVDHLEVTASFFIREYQKQN